MLLIGLIATLLLACDRSDPPPPVVEIAVTFERSRVRIETATDTFFLGVEIAENDQQRRVGLMRRTALPPDSGMIFLFQEPQPATGVFWMYNTLIPLSIAFIQQDGTIGSIRDMEPCPSPYPQYCPNYEANVPYVAALEVNRGYFSERGIRVGDRVLLER